MKDQLLIDIRGISQAVDGIGKRAKDAADALASEVSDLAEVTDNISAALADMLDRLQEMERRVVELESKVG